MLRSILVILLGALLTACAPQPQTSLASVSAPASFAASPIQAQAIGDRIRLDDEEFLTIRQVSNWTGTNFVEPAIGQSLIAVEVRIDGIRASGASIDPFWFSVEDAEHQGYSLVDSGKDPMLQRTDNLAPGTSATGWLTFSIPADMGKGLRLIYAPPFAAPVAIALE